MTRIVQRMVTAKLVVCRQLESDNRVTEVTMTSKGKQKLSDARMITAQDYAQIIRGFSIEDFEKLTHSLKRQHGNLAPLSPGTRNGYSLSEAKSSASAQQ